MYDNQTTTYEGLLENGNISTLHLGLIQVIALEVFTSLKNLNPKCMIDMFEIEHISYDLKD